MSVLTALAHRVGRAYVAKIATDEAANQTFRGTNERPVEYGFVFQWLSRLQPETVLDVGTGQSALPALLRTCGFVVTAIDNVRDYWPDGMVNRHWAVANEDIQKPAGSHAHDATLCISVFEHIPDPVAAIRGLHQRTKPGGHVILTTPFGIEAHPNVYTAPGSYGTTEPYVCRQSCPADLRAWLQEGLTLEHAEYWRLFDSPLWSVGPRVRPPEATKTPANLGCFVLRRQT